MAISPKILKEKVEINDFISNEEAKENKIIGLNNNEKQITLKRCFVDELGFQIFKGSGFEPLYNFFKTDKYLEIRVEIPGNVDVKKVGRAEYIGDLTHISIIGEKKRDKLPKNKDDNIESTREYGEFNVDITFKTEEFKIKSVPKTQTIKNGILYVKYEIEEEIIEENELPLTVNEDEDEKEE